MLNVVQFFDELQNRVNAIYTSKYILDEATRAGNKRPDSSLDKERLYLILVTAHDKVRGLPFQYILDKKFVNIAHEIDNSNPLRPFYNAYSRLLTLTDEALIDYLARHLVLDVSKPLQVFNAQGLPSELLHSAVGKVDELNPIIQDVKVQFKKFPYLAFLYSLSLCETHLPHIEGIANVGE